MDSCVVNANFQSMSIHSRWFLTCCCCGLAGAHKQMVVFQARSSQLQSRASDAEQRATEAGSRRSTAEESLTAAEERMSVLSQELEDSKERLTSAAALGPELESVKAHLKTAEASAEAAELQGQQLRKALHEQESEAAQDAEYARQQIQHLSNNCTKAAVVKAGMLFVWCALRQCMATISTVHPPTYVSSLFFQT